MEYTHKLYCKIWPGVGLVEALINDLLADLQWRHTLIVHKHLVKVDPVMIIFLLFVLTVLIVFGGTALDVVHSLDSVGCNFVGARNMSNAELVVGGCSYRVSMAGKGDRAGQGLKGMGGVEASRV